MIGIVTRTKNGVSHMVDMEIHAEMQLFIAGREGMAERRFCIKN